MRSAILGVLIAIMPFGGMRVICVDGPADAPAAHATAAAADDCTTVCELHRADGSRDGERCALSTDAASTLVMGGVAVMRPHMPLPLPTVTRVAVLDPRVPLLDPDLPHVAPPPRLHTL